MNITRLKFLSMRWLEICGSFLSPILYPNRTHPLLCEGFVSAAVPPCHFRATTWSSCQALMKRPKREMKGSLSGLTNIVHSRVVEPYISRQQKQLSISLVALCMEQSCLTAVHSAPVPDVPRSAAISWMPQLYRYLA